MRLLVVEDDKDLNRQIVTALENAGYAVDKAFDGEEGLYLGETEPYDAVILDLGLPKVDGVAVLQGWRKRRQDHARADPDRARPLERQGFGGFDAGADDYVTKPFHMSRNCWPASAPCCAAPLATPPPSWSAALCASTPAPAASWSTATPVKLTSHEYRLLAYLMHHQGRVVSRTELVEHLYDQDFDRDSNTIEVFVGRLRKKLGVEVIETVRGLGYIAAAAPEKV